ncbi:MAG: DUF948 domain-containing protein [bacterium]|nr:MAG: DUF948 domain-containing protein [bacterium]
MISQDFLYYSLGVGFLILVGFFSYAAHNLSKSLKEVTAILSKIDSITKDVESLKDIVKSGIMYLVNMFGKKAFGPSGPMARRGVKRK